MSPGSTSRSLTADPGALVAVLAGGLPRPHTLKVRTARRRPRRPLPGHSIALPPPTVPPPGCRRKFPHWKPPPRPTPLRRPRRPPKRRSPSPRRARSADRRCTGTDPSRTSTSTTLTTAATTTRYAHPFSLSSFPHQPPPTTSSTGLVSSFPSRPTKFHNQKTVLDSVVAKKVATIGSQSNRHSPGHNISIPHQARLDERNATSRLCLRSDRCNRPSATGVELAQTTQRSAQLSWPPLRWPRPQVRRWLGDVGYGGWCDDGDGH